MPSASRGLLYRKKLIAALLLVLALVVFRAFFLPVIIRNHVNKVLERMPDYTHHFDDIKISLLRGGYQIRGLKA